VGGDAVGGVPALEGCVLAVGGVVGELGRTVEDGGVCGVDDIVRLRSWVFRLLMERISSNLGGRVGLGVVVVGVQGVPVEDRAVPMLDDGRLWEENEEDDGGVPAVV